MKKLEELLGGEVTLDRIKDYIRGVIPEILTDAKSRKESLLNDGGMVTYYADQSDYNMDVLDRILAEHQDKYKGDMAVAKFFDTWWDYTAQGIEFVVAALTGGASEAVPVLEAVESLPKAVFAVYLGFRFKDYKLAGGLLAAEAASFIPVIGDIIDLLPIYKYGVNHAVLKSIEKEYLAEMEQLYGNQEIVTTGIEGAITETPLPYDPGNVTMAVPPFMHPYGADLVVPNIYHEGEDHPIYHEDMVMQAEPVIAL